MELSNLTAHNRLLMGIQSISAASALALSATPTPARPDEDATGSPDKRTWNKLFEATDGERICSTSLES